jgi:hypothetical protein
MCAFTTDSVIAAIKYNVEITGTCLFGLVIHDEPSVYLTL